MDEAYSLHLGVADQSRHSEYSLTGNAAFNQHYGAVYHQITTNHVVHTPAQPKPSLLPRCPTPSQNYTKRERIEDHMRSYFFNRGGRKCYVLHGPGGTGKTEVGLALIYEYCYSQDPENKRFSDAYWVDATTPETIEESFKAIALSTGVGSEAKDALLLLASHCGQGINWIVFFNNADNPELDLAKYFPNCSHGNILITTRNFYHARRYAVGPDSDYAVSQMTSDEALTLFKKHARISDNADPQQIEAAKVLVKELGYSALSVSRAGAFIAMSPYTLNQYITLYRERRRELLREHERMKTTSDYPYHSIHATLMVSYERLSDSAKDVIGGFGCMYHEGINEGIFSKSFSGGLDGLEAKKGLLFTESEKAGLAKLRKIGQSLSTNGNWDVIKFRRVVRELQLYSLVTFDPEKMTCSIHPLVHEWARNLGNVEEQSVLRQCTILMLGGSLVGFETAEDLAFCRALTLHVDEVFRGIDTKTSICGGRFGKVYWEAGRWNDAAAYQWSYQELCKQKLGEEHRETLTAIADVATTYEGQGRYNKAEELQVRVMEIRKRVLGAEDTDTLTAMNDLALTYERQHRLNEAEKLGSQVVEIRKRVLGADHPATLISMNILALVYSRQGRLNDSEKLHLQIMEARKRVLGAEHPDTLISMGNLALTYSYQRRFDEAERLQLQVLKDRNSVLGAEHPHTLTSMNNLASTYSNQQQFGKAEKLHLRVMEARRKVLGAEHPHTLISTGNLALVYSNQRQFDKAEKLHLLAVEALQRVLGGEHPHTLTSMNNLASTYSNQQLFDEAEKIHWHVLEARMRILGVEHPQTLMSVGNLASTYTNQRRFDEAERLELLVMKALEGILGAEHLDTLTSMGHLALTYSNQRRFDEAEKLQVQVLEARTRLLGVEHLDTLASMNNLASTYSGQRRFDKAEDLHWQVVEGLKRILGADHPHTLMSMSNLASTYFNQQRFYEAEKLHLQVLEARKKVLGVEHPDTLTSLESLASAYSSRLRFYETEGLHSQGLAVR